MRLLIVLAAVTACCCCATDARGDVKLAAIFSDHMVLQADKHAAIWGWADAGERVTIAIGQQQVMAEPDASGKWSAKLPPMKAGGPLTLHVSGHNSLTVGDVLVGEVWLCSGQSNMEMQVKGLHGEVVRADEEIAAANHPQIRMFVFNEVYDIYKLPVPPAQPMTDRPGQWVVCSPKRSRSSRRLATSSRADIQQELKVPVGLVHSSVGGTPVEAWTSLEKQKASPELKAVLDDWKKRLDGYDPAAEQKKSAELKAVWNKQKVEAEKKGEAVPKAPVGAAFKNLGVSNPGGLFNGMIAPLVPYTMRGVLWYQGERNAAGPLTKFYGKQLVAMVQDWRKRWGDDFYFGYVQLPRVQKEQQNPSESNGWGVWVRDGQRVALSSIPARRHGDHPRLRRPERHRWPSQEQAGLRAPAVDARAARCVRQEHAGVVWPDLQVVDARRQQDGYRVRPRHGPQVHRRRAQGLRDRGR
jgi:sialate O-acetylesterase